MVKTSFIFFGFCFFWIIGCQEHFRFRLLCHESLIIVPLLSILHTFSKALLAWSSLVHAYSMCPLVSTEVGIWEHAILTLGLTPVHWVSTALGFSLICWIHITISLLAVHCILIAIGLSLVYYVHTTINLLAVRCILTAIRLMSHVQCGVLATCCPLITLFSFVPVDREPCRKRSRSSRISPFTREGPCSSCQASRLFLGSAYCGACGYRLCAICTIKASTHSTTACIVSTFCST